MAQKNAKVSRQKKAVQHTEDTYQQKRGSPTQRAQRSAKTSSRKKA